MSLLKKVTIRLLDATDSHEIKRRNFQLVEGRLRVQQIQDYFMIKHLDWKEEDMIIGIRGDGLSDVSFTGDEVISIVNEEVLAQDGADTSEQQQDNTTTATQQSTLKPTPSVEGIKVFSRRGSGKQPDTKSEGGGSGTDTKSEGGGRITNTKSERGRRLLTIRENNEGGTDTKSEGPGWVRARAASLPPPCSPTPQHREHSKTVHSTQSQAIPPHLNPLNLQMANPHTKPNEGRNNFSNRNSSVLIGTCKSPKIPHDKTVQDFNFKLIIVGDINCGKTSIIRRYVDGKFSKMYKATIGVDFSAKEFIVSDHLNVRLQLWDVAGQERFGTFTRVYFQGAVGGMVVFDLTDVKTSAAVVKWKQDIDTKVTLENGMPIPVILVGNKSDLTKELAPLHTPEYLDKLCEENKFLAWFTTSCAFDRNVKEAFQYLGNTALENDLKFPSLREEDKSAIKLGMKQHEPAGAAKSGCCQT